MKIEFSDHALDQLQQRARIKREMVVETIINPDEKATSYKNRTIYRKDYNDETLEVVTVSEGGKIVVITEYILDRSHR